MSSEKTAISDVLKNAREAKGLTVKAVANDICVQSGYLKAIEAGQYDKLPAHAFAVGFVRSYANALGENADEIVARFKEESGVKNPVSEISVKPEHANAPRRVPAWLSPVAGIVGASFCWVVWGGSFSSTAMIAGNNDPVAREEAQLAALSVAVEEIKDENNANRLGEETEAAEHHDAAPKSFFLPAAYAEPTPEAQLGGDFLVKAETDSWVRLSRSDGSEIWAGILKAGQELAPVDEVLLSTSNAGALLVSDSGEGLKYLGQRGEILIDAELHHQKNVVSGGHLGAIGSR